MSDKPENPAAFPRAVGFSYNNPGSGKIESFGGMTLRDYFAAAAMQGHLSCPESDATMDFVATVAYEYADAMLKQRAK